MRKIYCNIDQCLKTPKYEHNEKLYCWWHAHKIRKILVRREIENG